jgi:nucleoside-diphosphate-sugar epimerase
MRLVKLGVPLPLGGVDNRRSFVALDNLVDFLCVSLAHRAAANEAFLVSDGEDLSTPDLIRRLARAMHRPARLVAIPAVLLVGGATLLCRRNAAQRLIGSFQVDISKARALLGWAPLIGVDEGLRRCVAGT